MIATLRVTKLTLMVKLPLQKGSRRWLEMIQKSKIICATVEATPKLERQCHQQNNRWNGRWNRCLTLEPPTRLAAVWGGAAIAALFIGALSAVVNLLPLNLLNHPPAAAPVEPLMVALNTPVVKFKAAVVHKS